MEPLTQAEFRSLWKGGATLLYYMRDFVLGTISRMQLSFH